MKRVSENTQTTQRQKGNTMDRDQAITLMTETVNQVNMDLGYQHKMPLEEMQKMIEQQYEQVKYINTIVYDTMKSKGIIAE